MSSRAGSANLDLDRPGLAGLGLGNANGQHTVVALRLDLRVVVHRDINILLRHFGKLRLDDVVVGGLRDVGYGPPLHDRTATAFRARSRGTAQQPGIGCA